MAIRMWERRGPLVLVDLGTNGRSLSAMPVNSTLQQPPLVRPSRSPYPTRNARSLPGAIERVAFDDGQIRYQVVGGKSPPESVVRDLSTCWRSFSAMALWILREDLFPRSLSRAAYLKHFATGFILRKVGRRSQ